MSSNSVVRANFNPHDDPDFIRKVMGAAESFATVRAMPEKYVKKFTIPFFGKMPKKLDYSLASLSEVDVIFSLMGREELALFTTSPILTNGLRTPMTAAVAYLGEVIKRRSTRGFEWADLGVWSDQFVRKNYREADVPPALNLISADGSRVIALIDCIDAKIRSGWTPIAAAIQKSLDFDAFLDRFAGRHLFAADGLGGKG